MKMSFTIDDKEVNKMLKNATKALEDPRPALKKIKSFQLKSISEAYKTSGKNIAGAWKKLRPSTLKEKLRSGFHTGILVRTGKMRDSHKEKILNKKRLEIENKTNYFKYHQKGTKKMPRRQVHGHSNKMIQRVLEIYQDYIIKIIKRG